MEVKFSRMSLGTLGAPVDTAFGEALDEVARAFHNCENLEQTSDGKVKASVTVAIELEYNPEKGATFISTRITNKLPRRRSAADSIRLTPGGFFIETDADQPRMFDRPEGSISHRTKPVPTVPAPEED